MIKSKKINIFWKLKNSAFAKKNKDVLFESERRIGSSVTAVAKMITCEEEMKNLMPEVLSLSSTSPFWDDRLKYYWDSISEPIFEGGKELEIGYNYNTSIARVSENIKLFNKNVSEKEQLTTEESIAEYFEKRETELNKRYSDAIVEASKLDAKTRNEQERIAYDAKYDALVELEKIKYKFGKPINVNDYLLYRYCLGYRDVANDIKYIDKSPSIRFYLYSDAQIKEDRDRHNKVKQQAMKLYLSVISDGEQVENILYVLGKGFELIGKELTETDKAEILEREYLNNTDKFIMVANDKTVKDKGRVEKLIAKGILKRLPNTDVIVDSADGTVVLGNTVDEAVSYLANEKNKQKLNEFIGRYKTPTVN